ncbi:MAG: hypothetical protein ACLUJI_01305 [Faecalibacillus faecis]|uniref:hypothetical protein n=1 Tax=Faecalibacillus faecis TaxID=1982628 RepID=UPI0039956846
MKNHLTLNEFLESFINESYDITIVDATLEETCNDYVIVKTDKKYKDSLRDELLNSNVWNFEIDYDNRLVIGISYR